MLVVCKEQARTRLSRCVM